MRSVLIILSIAIPVGLFAQVPQSQPVPRSDSATQQQRTGPPADRSEVSSSKDTKIDLSPPPGDHPTYTSGDADNTGVTELKPWDPHKAAKDVEVGDFYLQQKNYNAAISRYREALEYKPNDAIATFKLAVALEKNGELTEARQNFEAYLKSLPKGSYADEARSHLEKLKPNTAKSEQKKDQN
jgi:tetratricopeptide (TPR) repeat protein